jgi:hypothetical protein
VQQPTNTFAVVRFAVEGWHSWPDAQGKRVYLASPHRHLFHVEVRLQVFHDEREVEYHDLLDLCKVWFPGGEMGSKSCETMARELLQKVTAHFPKRSTEVHCFEDGEVGSIIHHQYEG